MYCVYELTQHTVHLQLTCLHSTQMNNKKMKRSKKNIEVITPTENHVYAKFLFSQYQIINDDTAKS